jgi:hypothetical protein
MTPEVFPDTTSKLADCTSPLLPTVDTLTRYQYSPRWRTSGPKALRPQVEEGYWLL